MLTAIRNDTGLACLITAAACLVAVATSRWWTRPTNEAVDLLASCGLALSLAAVIFGLLRLGSVPGRVAAVGGALAPALLLI